MTTAFNGLQEPISQAFKVGEDLSAARYKYGVVASDQSVSVVSTAGSKVDGVITTQSESVSVVLTLSGVIKTIASAAIAIGADVSADSNGLSRTALSTDFIVGTCLSTASDSGETVTINLLPRGYQEIGSTAMATYAPTVAYTTADPVSPVTDFRYKRVGNMVYGTATIASSDGAGCTNVTITAPVAAANNTSVSSLHTMKTPVVSVLYVDTTHTAPVAYLDHSDSTFKAVAFTATDDKEFLYSISFMYETA